MNSRTNNVITWCCLLAVVGGGWYGYVHRSAIKNRFFSARENLPVAVNHDVAARNVGVNSNTNGAVNMNNAVTPLPKEYNLNIAFTSQAPDANWDQDHEEFCEEAAVFMVGRYWQDRTIKDKADAEAGLQQIKIWELANLGYYYDTTASETASILTGMYQLSFDLVENPTITTIKQAVASGNPVIVPTDGRLLGNPNFRQPGPVYHNLVIKGYTEDGKFITNDPGTRKGADYVYEQSVIMNAMHDWVPGGDRTKPGNGSATGQKVIIIAHGS